MEVYKGLTREELQAQYYLRYLNAQFCFGFLPSRDFNLDFTKDNSSSLKTVSTEKILNQDKLKEYDGSLRFIFDQEEIKLFIIFERLYTSCTSSHTWFNRI